MGDLAVVQNGCLLVSGTQGCVGVKMMGIDKYDKIDVPICCKQNSKGLSGEVMWSCVEVTIEFKAGPRQARPIDVKTPAGGGEEQA